MTALDEALARGEDALDWLPGVLKEAHDARIQAVACRDTLLRVRDRVTGAGRLSPPDQRDLRRDFLRDVGRVRRVLSRRITWLSLRLFWRRSRFWIMVALLSFLLFLAAGWVVKNRVWLVGQVVILLADPAPEPVTAPLPDAGGQDAPGPQQPNQSGTVP